MVTLEAYLDHAHLSRAAFAEAIGVSKETVRRYIVGSRIPDRTVMEKIASATACKVTANDFFGIAA